MEKLVQTCERIAATTKKSEKIAILAEYFRSREPADAMTSAVFLSGRAFPAFEERTLQVGGALLWRIVSELADASDNELKTAYRQHGDLGSAACELLEGGTGRSLQERISLAEVRRAFEDIAATRTAAAKATLLKAL